MNIDDIKADSAQAFAQHLGVSGAEAAALLPSSPSAEKVYETFILKVIYEMLDIFEECTLYLRGGNKLVLKTSPGPDQSQLSVDRGGKRRCGPDRNLYLYRVHIDELIKLRRAQLDQLRLP